MLVHFVSLTYCIKNAYLYFCSLNSVLKQPTTGQSVQIMIWKLTSKDGTKINDKISKNYLRIIQNALLSISDR